MFGYSSCIQITYADEDPECCSMGRDITEQAVNETYGTNNGKSYSFAKGSRTLQRFSQQCC